MSAPASELDPDNRLDTSDPESSGSLGWQLLLPVGFLVLGVAILISSTQFPDSAAAVTEPGLYPGIVSAVLIVASLLSILELVAVRAKQRRSGQPTAHPASRQQRQESRRTWARAAVVTVLSILYVVVIPYLGFVVTTFVYCFGIAALLRAKTVRGIVGAAVIAAGLVAAAYYGFEVGLNAPLPDGELF